MCKHKIPLGVQSVINNSVLCIENQFLKAALHVQNLYIKVNVLLLSSPSFVENISESRKY
jgi:hypothetical protein